MFRCSHTIIRERIISVRLARTNNAHYSCVRHDDGVTVTQKHDGAVSVLILM